MYRNFIYFVLTKKSFYYGLKKNPIHNSIHRFSCLQCVFQRQETFLHCCATISVHSTLLSIFPNQSSTLSTQVLWSLLPPSPALPRTTPLQPFCELDYVLHENEIIQYLSFSVWLILCRLISLSFTLLQAK